MVMIAQSRAEAPRWESARASLLPTDAVRSAVEALEKLGAAPIHAALVPIESIDGEGFATLAGIDRFAATNCILIVGSRGDELTQNALVIPGGEKADLNGRVRKLLGARRVSLAGNELLERTGMQKGAVGPIGLPPDWSVWIDERLRSLDTIYCGGGALQCKLKLRAVDLGLLAHSSFASLTKGEDI